MNEHLQVLHDFVQEPAEVAQEPLKAGSGNLTPVDASSVAAKTSAAPAAEQSKALTVVPKLQKPQLAVKVPGGITAVLVFILFIIFAVMPVQSGQTRLQLLWSVLTKGGSIRGQRSINPQGDTGSTDSVEQGGPQLMPPVNDDPSNWTFDPLKGGFVPKMEA